MEEKIKFHFRRPSDTEHQQHPDGVVFIPPLTLAQYNAVKNWNVAAQIATWTFTVGLTAGLFSTIGSRGGVPGAFAGAVLGAVTGATWGAYEVSCLTSVQEEFDKAYERHGGVAIGRKGWKYNVASSTDTYTHVNAPLSALYVAATTFLLTGKLP